MEHLEYPENLQIKLIQFQIIKYNELLIIGVMSKRRRDHSNSFHPFFLVIIFFLNWSHNCLRFFLLYLFDLVFRGILNDIQDTFSRAFNYFGVAYNPVNIFEYLKYSSQFYMNIFPACSLSALYGKGTIRRHLTTSKMLERDQAAGFQSFLRVLTQISPFYETLGWNILVMKQPR